MLECSEPEEAQLVMREKTIFDGRIDGTPKEIQEVVDMFLFEELQLPGIDFRVEPEGTKQIWAIYRPVNAGPPGSRIINGYIEITGVSISEEAPSTVRLISCRQELDLLFFQLSQRLQAKFIIKGFPPELLTTAWRELAAKGYITPLAGTLDDVFSDGSADPRGVVGKFGRNRDLTLEDVTRIVSRCREFQARDGTIEAYYNHVLAGSLTDKFALGTLKGWLKDPRFKEAKEVPRNLPR